MATIQPIRVFISSPGDLYLERKAIKELLDDLNKSPHYMNNYKFISYAYEDVAPPVAGSKEAQEIVDKYVLRPEQSDIFICMLWSRMGTPTGSLINPDTKKPYNSGTEYEFLTAYRHSLDLDKPRILLYRCVRPLPSLNEINSKQIELVISFFQRFEAGGDLKGLYLGFASIEELTKTVRRNIELILTEDIRNDSTSPSVLGTLEPVFHLPTNLPLHLVEREQLSRKIIQSLISTTQSNQVICLHGLGGIGKSVLARSICNDKEILKTFSGGILWATLGINADIQAIQRDWLTTLKDDLSEISSLESGKVRLQKYLNDRHMLIVLDDVWNAEAIKPLFLQGSKCSYLITTRDVTNIESSILIQVPKLETDESLQLLKNNITDNRRNDISEEIQQEIVQRLGNHPLAIRIVANLLSRNIYWEDITEALREGDLSFVSHGQSSVMSVIAKSVETLSDLQKEKYKDFVVFKSDKPIHIPLMQELWSRTSGFRARNTRMLIAEFQDRALLHEDNSIHDLQYDYLRSIVNKAKQIELHEAVAKILFDAIIDEQQHNSDIFIYAIDNIIYHLDLAGNVDRALKLLTDLSFMHTKLSNLGVSALIDDLLIINDERLKPLLETIRSGARILQKEPSQISDQIIGRLGSLSILSNSFVIPKTLMLKSKTLARDTSMHSTDGHIGAVTDCVFVPNINSYISVGADSNIRVWNSKAESLAVIDNHEMWIERCAIDPTGRILATGSQDSTICIVSLETYQILQRLSGHGGSVNCVVFSPEGKLISGSDDGTLKIWDVGKFNASFIASFKYEGHEIVSCDISPDSSILVAGTRDGSLFVQNTTSPMMQHIQAHSGSLRALKFLNNSHLISGGDDGIIVVWDPLTMTKIKTYSEHTAAIRSIDISSQSLMIAVASADYSATVINIENDVVIQRYSEHLSWVNGISFVDDTDVLTASGDGTLHLWGITSKKTKLIFPGNESAIRGISSNRGGFITASGNGELNLWQSEAVIHQSNILKQPDGIRTCGISSSGKHIVLGDDNGTLKIVDLVTKKILHTKNEHKGIVRYCTYDYHDNYIMSVSDDAKCIIWSAKDASIVKVNTLTNDRMRSGAFSVENKKVIVGSVSGRIHVWSLEGYKETSVLAHKGAVRCISASRESNIFITGSYDYLLHLWDSNTLERLRTFNGHTNIVMDCRIIEQDKYLISVSEDGYLILWDIQKGTQVSKWLHETALLSCDYDDLNNTICVGDNQGRVHFLTLNLPGG